MSSFHFRVVAVLAFSSLLIISDPSYPQTNSFSEEVKYPDLFTGRFSLTEFQFIENAVKRNHIDRTKLNSNAAYSSAAEFASERLGFFFFTEKYYQDHKNDERRIPRGEMIKINPSDSYLFIKPLVSRSAKAAEARELTNQEYTIKQELFGVFSKTNFNFTDLQDVLNFLIESRKEPLIKPNKYLKRKDDLILSAVNGFLSSLDPHSNAFIKENLDDSITSKKKDSETYITSSLMGTRNDIGYLKIKAFHKPINEKTASGAELFAGSLQYHKRAILFGERSYGNGTIQRLMFTGDNDKNIFKITTGRSMHSRDF